MNNSPHCNFVDSSMIIYGDVKFIGDALINGHVVGSVACVGEGARLILGESSSVGKIRMPERSVVRRLQLSAENEWDGLSIRDRLDDDQLLNSTVLSLAWGPFVGKIKAGKDVLFYDEGSSATHKTSTWKLIINLFRKQKT